VLAVDPNHARTEGLRELAAARGINNVAVATAGWMKDVDHSPKTFDRVLIDAPCSNSGVLARRPEARYRQDAQTLRSLEKLQRDILLDTVDAVAPGGLLIYSTCSVWSEENEQISRWFLERHPQFALLRERSTLPSFDADPTRYHDGGYFAVFARK
jgi:16S rRNA (cytosine967-C5)-methyltransferase